MDSNRSTKNVAILGATGSIGMATVDVVGHLDRVDPAHQWRVWAASGHRNLDGLADIVGQLPHAPRRLVLSDPDTAGRFPAHASFHGQPDVDVGPDALVDVAADPSVDIVVAAIVGRAGLESTLAAIDAGKRVALANKETLVVAGPLVRSAMADSGAELLPVDSEHSAIFQCMGESATSRHSHNQDRAASDEDPTCQPTDRGKQLSRQAIDPDGQRWSVSPVDTRTNAGGDAEIGSRPSDLANGSEDHDRFSHDDEQIA